MTKQSPDPTAPRIQDAVEDQFHDRWIKFGTATRNIWFSLGELQTSASDVFGKLSRVGATYLTDAKKTAFKTIIEDHPTFRSSLVAARPGWIENCYVFGDGTKCMPPGDDREIITAFEGDSKFDPRGSLQAWQNELGPLLGQQSYPLFAIYLALVGPLLRFAPPDYINPVFELVGGPHCGKTTVGVVAASTTAGDETSDVGGGETWDLTLAALDPLREAHCDNFLLLDEGNLAGADQRKAQEVLRAAVFRLAGSGKKRRYGDTGPSEQINLATLSTSNTRLAELVSANSAVMGALQSRMITLVVGADRPHGVLSSLPPGFDEAEKVIVAMRAAANHNYGGAARRFVQKLGIAAMRDEAALRARVAGRLRKFESHRALAGFSGSPRVRKAFSIVYAAGWLAIRYGVLPSDWKKPMRTVTEIFGHYLASEGLADVRGADQDGHLRVLAYVKAHNLAAVELLKTPVSKEELSRSAGFLRGSGTARELLISTERFREQFRDGTRLLKDLRSRGLLHCEDGKLTIKAPRALCAAGRVYCISLTAPR